MATRFYLPSSGSVPISPSVSSEWESSWQFTRRPAVTTKSNTSFVNDEGYDTPGSTPMDICKFQYISGPLEAQTITGTVKGQIRVYEGEDDDDACRALVIRVVSNDGATVRGTLLAHFPSSLESEWATSATNRYFPPSGTSVTSVDAQAGDRLLIEIGVRRFAANSGYHRYRMGDNASSDLPEDETSTSDYNPWIEFSQTLDFMDAIHIGQVNATVEYTPGSPQIRVGFVGVQVEYAPTPPGQFTYNGNVTAIVSPSSDRDWEGVYSGNVNIVVGCAGTYSWNDGNDYTYIGNVTCINTPSSTIIRGLAYVGSVYCYVGTDGETSSTTRVYVGNVTAVVNAAGNYSTPIPGWDKYFGYGLVEVGDLDEPPPFWCVEEGDDNQIVANVNLEANYSFYAETDIVMSGGAELGGDLGLVDIDPSAYQVFTSGGLVLSGLLPVSHIEPAATAITLTGGAEIGGELAFSFVGVDDIPFTHKETRGGVVVGGTLTPITVDPSSFVLDVTLGLSGELRAGESRRAPVTFYTPTAEQSGVIEHNTAGGVLLGGTGSPVWGDTPVYEEGPITRSTGDVIIGGACLIAWEVPVTIALELSGGMVLDGLADTVAIDVVYGGAEGESTQLTESVFETWVLNGPNFEPSIYSGFRFNSYARYGNKYYAAGEDGIYLLDGDDDDGLPIKPGVRLGPMNFNTTSDKRIRSIHMQGAGEPEVRISGENTGAESFHSLDERRRISSCRTVQDEAITVEIVNFEELSQIEITPVVLLKR